MDKIRYILDLNRIRLPDNVKAAALTAAPDTVEPAVKIEKKKGRGGVIAAAAAAAVLLLTAAVVFGIASYKKTHGGNTPGTETAPGSETVTDKGAATTADTDPGVITSAPPVDPEGDELILFNTLYREEPVYDMVLDAGACIKTPDNVNLIVSDDLSPLTSYFGTDNTDDICRTLFAFYDKGNIRELRSISSNSPAEYINIKNRLANRGKGAEDGFEPVSAIFMSGRSGTFEYLLAAEFYENGGTLFNSAFEPVGEVRNEKFCFRLDRIETLDFTIYKIRFENGIPVIYSALDVPKYQLKQRKQNDSGGYRTINEALGYDISETGARTEADHFLFKCTFEIFDDFFVSMSCQEQINPGIKGKIGGDLCDYPYSVPVDMERSLYCDIINKYNLQWFLPMFRYHNETGHLVIIGDGIKSGDAPDAKAVPDRLGNIEYVIIPIGLDSYDRKYTRFYDDTTETDLYYAPMYTDRPFFNSSYFNGINAVTRKFIRIEFSDSVADRLNAGNHLTTSISMEEIINTPAIADTAYKTPDILYGGQLLYIKENITGGGTGFPQYPLSADLLPYVSKNKLDEKTTAMYTENGITITYPDFTLKDPERMELRLGQRDIAVFSHEYTVLTYAAGETEKPSADGNGVRGDHVFTAAEFRDGCVIDLDGIIYGFYRGGMIYPFTNANEPDNTLTVSVLDGEMLSIKTKEIPLEFSGVDRFEKYGNSGVMYGAAAYLLSRMYPTTAIRSISIKEYYGLCAEVRETNPYPPVRIYDGKNVCYRYQISDNSYVIMKNGVKVWNINDGGNDTLYTIDYNFPGRTFDFSKVRQG